MKNLMKFPLNIQMFAGDSTNTFKEDVETFLPLLDELYAKESLTAMFEIEGVEFNGTTSIKLPSVITSGNGDYSRTNGYTLGSIDVSYETYKLTHDRGRKFQIDAVEENELNIDLVSVAMTQFERLENIPEIDAIRFAKMAHDAGHKKSEDFTTAEQAVEAYDDVEVQALSMGMSLSNSTMFVSASYYKLIKNYIKGSINVNANNGLLNRAIKELDDGLKIVVVPTDRFYSEIKLLSGADKEEAGGYEPVSGVTKEINFLIVENSVPKAITKRKANKLIPPELNQTHDGYALFYRSMHDLITFKNQRNKMYVSVKTTPITVGGGE